jgi:hypothetical protein
VSDLAENAEKRNAMAAASALIGKIDGAEIIARAIYEKVAGGI